VTAKRRDEIKNLKKYVGRGESCEEEDVNECLCIECAVHVQCIKCHKWAHDSCAKFSDFYVCGKCNYDDIDDLVSEDCCEVILNHFAV
jgi:hypothetical protein